jgi:hypothetical protein
MEGERGISDSPVWRGHRRVSRNSINPFAHLSGLRSNFKVKEVDVILVF